MAKLKNYLCIFFFNDTATTEIYTLSLHDALPILVVLADLHQALPGDAASAGDVLEERHDVVGLLGAAEGDEQHGVVGGEYRRSEEHTSELQSRQYLVCRLLLEKKNTYYDFRL